VTTTLGDGFEKHAIGQPVPRTEDPRLLRGDGRYTDDVSLPGEAHAFVFRSPYAHGRITRLDVAAARTAPGVLDVLVAADLDAEGCNAMFFARPLKNRDGSDMRTPHRPVLAGDRVRFRGEAVAMVVAQSAAQAKDAAELIELDVDALPAVTDAKAALAEGAPCLHEDAPGNLSLDWEYGDAQAVERAFAGARHVTRLTLRSNRLVVSALEPRAAVAIFEEGRYRLHAPSQGVFGFRNSLAEKILGVTREELHVLTPDVGGSFGMKSAPYPEYVALLVAARRLGRPVKWCDERSDSFVSDQHGRDSYADAELAFDADGRILAGRVQVHCNLGAYLTAVGPNMHTRNVPRNFPGPYRVALFHSRTFAAFTNTTPIGAYRGAGRPEGVYYMERLLDTAAREMGIDAVTLRRRNLITPAELPYAAVSELSYDSGDYPALLEEALARCDWEGFEHRRAESAARGLLRGRGLACYLEVTGPPATEMGGLRFRDDGSVLMVSGSLNYGQGHAVTFAQIVSDRLGIPLQRLELLQGDSDALIAGAGTGGSRSVICAGSALLAAADAVVEKGRVVAGHVLEAAVEDIEFASGVFRVAGTDRGVEILELAARARALGGAGGALPESMDTAIAEQTPPSAFPNGCHVAEVEIDPKTGVVRLVRYTVVDDFGTLINPMLVEGQVHGGIAQGLGQALLEEAVYDADGQLVAGSYMDYALPRADDLPAFTFASRPIPAKTNPLGAKGCGEAGTTGALPAVMNAVVDVLARESGITHLDMPATPQRVWAALHRREVSSP
jgi:carbon-monoxide dehydrogenase large subunit